jgi:hypothetical protein
MPCTSLAVIVASLHGRTGNTLLARTFADYFILSGPRPYIFDTDAVDRGLHALFPHDAFVVDLTIVPDQMLLFDTLVVRSARTRIVDVTHRSLITFFQLMRDSDFVSEAWSCKVEPVIFYLPESQGGLVRGRRGPAEYFSRLSLCCRRERVSRRLPLKARPRTGWACRNRVLLLTSRRCS